MSRTQSIKKNAAKAGAKTVATLPVKPTPRDTGTVYLSVPSDVLTNLVSGTLGAHFGRRPEVGDLLVDDNRRLKEAAPAITLAGGAQGLVNTVKEAPEILGACDRLSGRTTELENRLLQLADKLGPILRQEPAPQNAGDCAKSEGAPLPESQLGQMLYAYGDHVTRLSAMVAELNRRVRL